MISRDMLVIERAARATAGAARPDQTLTCTPPPQVQNVQADGISALAFAPNADYLAVASWSNEVRIFEVGQGGQSIGKAQYTHEGASISGGTDNAGRIYDVATSQPSQFAAHDAPIKCVKWVDINGQGVVATGSWDKVCTTSPQYDRREVVADQGGYSQTVKYWDLRTPTAIATVQLPERCYTLDSASGLMVAGTAEKHVCVFNLSKSNPSPVLSLPLMHPFPQATPRRSSRQSLPLSGTRLARSHAFPTVPALQLARSRAASRSTTSTTARSACALHAAFSTLTPLSHRRHKTSASSATARRRRTTTTRRPARSLPFVPRLVSRAHLS
jgi:hypothetical protein